MDTDPRLADLAEELGPDQPERRRRRKIWLGAAGVCVVALAVFAVVWFEPFVDEGVDDPVPTARQDATDAPDDDAAASDEAATDDDATGDDATTTTAPVAPAEPVDLATGSFVSLDHATSGSVRILALEDGQRFVRLEGFETDNGPDLFVYLSTNPAGGSAAAFDDDFVNLGSLQGNIGDQDYVLPPEVDPNTYASVVIWCDSFDVAFGAADIVAA